MVLCGRDMAPSSHPTPSYPGTTAAAMYTAERGGLRTVIADAAWSAYRRSLEMGGKDSNVGPGRAKRASRQ